MSSRPFLTGLLPPPPRARRAALMPLSIALHGAAIATALALAPVIGRSDGREPPPATLVFAPPRPAAPAAARPTPVPLRRAGEVARPAMRIDEPAPAEPPPVPAGPPSLEAVENPPDTPACLSGACGEGPGEGPTSSEAASGVPDGAGSGGAPLRIGGHVRPPQRVRYVAPVYPSLALTARVAGTVVLDCVIDRDGQVSEVHVLSGHPLLASAAANAVGQWRYTPTELNGTPLAVMMTVTVRFVPRF